MGEVLIPIQPAVPVVAEDEVTFFAIGSAGDPGACRRLVFPASVTPLLIPIIYAIAGQCKNPDRTFNLDNAVLPHPITSAVRTLGSTRVLRFEEEVEDVIVTEVWVGSQTQLSMITALFRQFYEYLINAKLIPSEGPDFIHWEPRDRTEKIYNVELLSLSVGDGEGERRFDVLDLRDAGGDEIENALDGLSPVPTGGIDRSVTLRMRIISEVP
jgi:hypothetical protein